MYGSHSTSDLAERDLLAVFDLQLGAVHNRVALAFAALLVDHRDRALRFITTRSPLPLTVVTGSMKRTVPLFLASRRDCSETRDAVPPMWKVRMVSWVPGSPMDCAAMTPVASPSSTRRPEARLRP